ncbi:hypothetical protein [Xanthomonas medicagonis]|uniref:hypothetical protein n=1 Tax=Xanthomonas medicagonis TaxID=3160841 RepID=UPI003516F379
MQLMLLAIVVITIVNIIASVVVLRVPVFSSSQRLWQFGLIWLVPIIGAVVCAVFASTQAPDPASPGTVDPLYLPSDGGVPDGPGIGICGCSGVDGYSGGAGGD